MEDNTGVFHWRLGRLRVYDRTRRWTWIGSSAVGLRVGESAQSRGQRAFSATLLDLLSLRVVDDTMASKTLLHGEAATTARVGTGVEPLLLVEGADVALQVEGCGEGSFTIFSGTAQHHPRLAVHSLVLLQIPGV